MYIKVYIYITLCHIVYSFPKPVHLPTRERANKDKTNAERANQDQTNATSSQTIQTTSDQTIHIAPRRAFNPNTRLHRELKPFLQV